MKEVIILHRSLEQVIYISSEFICILRIIILRLWLVSKLIYVIHRQSRSYNTNSQSYALFCPTLFHRHHPQKDFNIHLFFLVVLH